MEMVIRGDKKISFICPNEERAKEVYNEAKSFLKMIEGDLE